MPLSLFQLLGPVIDREVNFIASRQQISVEEVYELLIDEAERNQSEWFSNTIPNLNYESPCCRLAYLYIVAAANAAIFQHVLESDEALRSYILQVAEARCAIRICAFGAGPGTELLGIAKFFETLNLGYSVGVDFQLLDKVMEWQNSWYGIRDEIINAFLSAYGNNRSNWPMIPSGNFVACDVTEIDRLPNLGNVWNQDIYVMNFLLSEIFINHPGLRAFLTEIVRFAPTGARFILIERRGPMWQRNMKAIAADSGLQLSDFIESQRGFLEGENPEDLGSIFEAIGERKMPRLSWNIVYSIGVKI
ncbi:MAG TPA: hypothetical protein VE262_03810 [Blastocatellia bacterium]|nr:hypothetical protein [Blastocatellia bacterium]